VQVCPVGIDIRNGLQYECIGCGLCVDACNTVMDKMQYPRGLDPLLHPERLWRVAGGKAEMLKRVLRPRVLIYTAILVALSLGMLAEPGHAHAPSRWMWCATERLWPASWQGASWRTSIACRS
jgi:polyferredoxin